MQPTIEEFKAWGAEGGRRGGPARARKLSKKRMQQIARMGGLAKAAKAAKAEDEKIAALKATRSSAGGE